MRLILCMAILGAAGLGSRAEDAGRINIGDRVITVERAVVWMTKWSGSHRDLFDRMRSGTVTEVGSKSPRTIFWVLARSRGGPDGDVVFLLERESPSRVSGTAVVSLDGGRRRCSVSGQWLLGADLEGRCDGGAGALKASFSAVEIGTPFILPSAMEGLTRSAVPTWDVPHVEKCSIEQNSVAMWVSASNGGYFVWAPLLEGDLYVRVDPGAKAGAAGRAEVCERATHDERNASRCRKHLVLIDRKSPCVVTVTIAGHTAFDARVDPLAASGLWKSVQAVVPLASQR